MSTARGFTEWLVKEGREEFDKAIRRLERADPSPVLLQPEQNTCQSHSHMDMWGKDTLKEEWRQEFFLFICEKTALLEDGSARCDGAGKIPPRRLLRLHLLLNNGQFHDAVHHLLRWFQGDEVADGKRHSSKPFHYYYRRTREVLKGSPGFFTRAVGSPHHRWSVYSLEEHAPILRAVERLRGEGADRYRSDWPSPLEIVPVEACISTAKDADGGIHEKYLFSGVHLKKLARFFWETATSAKFLGKPWYLPIRELIHYLRAHYHWMGDSIFLSRDENPEGERLTYSDESFDSLLSRSGLEYDDAIPCLLLSGPEIDSLVADLLAGWPMEQQIVFFCCEVGDEEGGAVSDINVYERLAGQLNLKNSRQARYIHSRAKEKLQEYMRFNPILSTASEGDQKKFLSRLIDCCEKNQPPSVLS